VVASVVVEGLGMWFGVGCWCRGCETTCTSSSASCTGFLHRTLREHSTVGCFSRSPMHHKHKQQRQLGWHRLQGFRNPVVQIIRAWGRRHHLQLRSVKPRFGQIGHGNLPSPHGTCRVRAHDSGVVRPQRITANHSESQRHGRAHKTNNQTHRGRGPCQRGSRWCSEA